jgi:hypothetical protein
VIAKESGFAEKFTSRSAENVLLEGVVPDGAVKLTRNTKVSLSKPLIELPEPRVKVPRVIDVEPGTEKFGRLMFVPLNVRSALDVLSTTVVANAPPLNDPVVEPVNVTSAALAGATASNVAKTAPYNELRTRISSPII